MTYNFTTRLHSLAIAARSGLQATTPVVMVQDGSQSAMAWNRSLPNMSFQAELRILTKLMVSRCLPTTALVSS
jgi:hypothetical protein